MHTHTHRYSHTHSVHASPLIAHANRHTYTTSFHIYTLIQTHTTVFKPTTDSYRHLVSLPSPTEQSSLRVTADMLVSPSVGRDGMQKWDSTEQEQEHEQEPI